MILLHMWDHTLHSERFELLEICVEMLCWSTTHHSFFFASSVSVEEPETRQHRHAARHHPHRTLPHSGVWVSCEYIDSSTRRCSRGVDLSYASEIWIVLTVAVVSSRTVTLNSTWTTAGISWACITSRWASSIQCQNTAHYIPEREGDFTSVRIHPLSFNFKHSSSSLPPHKHGFSIWSWLFSSQEANNQAELFLRHFALLESYLESKSRNPMNHEMKW